VVVLASCWRSGSGC